MPSFRITSPTTTVFRWDGLGRYDITASTATSLVLTFSSGKAGRAFEPAREAWAVRMTLKGGEVVETRYLDQAGKEIARITGTDTDADLVRALFDPNVDNGWRVYDLLLQDGATFQGNAAATWPTGVNDLTTSLGDDLARANGGNTLFKDKGGADTYIAGADYDMLSYGEWFWRMPERALRGIDADLGAGKVVGPDGSTDRLKGAFEGLQGTHLDDRMTGNKLDNAFHGFAGADRIDGGAGSDEVRYETDIWQGGQRGVVVNLKKGIAKDGFGDRDKLISIEAARGTDFRDKFVDGGGDNVYRGQAGNDVFVIAGGDDAMEGGAGADRFIFTGTGFGADNEIWDFDPAAGDRLKIAAAKGMGDLTLTQEDEDLHIELNTGARVTLEDFILGSTDPASFVLF